MQFATALIEYLISGIVASIWIMMIIDPDVTSHLNKFDNYKDIFVLMYFPIAYVIGMYIDTISSFILNRLNEIYSKLLEIKFLGNIHKVSNCFIKKVFGEPKENSYKKSAKILSYSEVDIIRTMESYVSRDRIARGMLLNSFITGIVCVIYLKFTIAIVCLFFSIISFLVWVRLDRLSSKFKDAAIENLEARKEMDLEN